MSYPNFLSNSVDVMSGHISEQEELSEDLIQMYQLTIEPRRVTWQAHTYKIRETPKDKIIISSHLYFACVKLIV